MSQDVTFFNNFQSNMSKDQNDIEKTEYKEMYRICDERLNYVKEMIYSSESYLAYDKENEQKIKEEEI